MPTTKPAKITGKDWNNLYNAVAIADEDSYSNQVNVTLKYFNSYDKVRANITYYKKEIQRLKRIAKKAGLNV